MMPDTIVDPKSRLRQKILGLKIRHARTEAGLTLKDLGQALGLSASLVSEIEFGQHDVTLPQLEVMALLFNVPVSYFWAEDPIEAVERSLPTVEAIVLRQRIIGVLLRQARTEAGHSQEEVANFLGVPVSQIVAYELGETEIPLSALESVAGYLEVSLEYFVDQGLSFNEVNGHLTLNELARYSELPKEVREFLSNPANLLYINIAMRLSDLSAETLRSLAEGLLEVTY
jgi:transcriptional regulator with XRE-family HTH domain